MFIYITSNIGISKHEKHLRLLSSGKKLFITFEFKGFSTWERGTIFRFRLFSSVPPTISCDTCPRPPRASESQPSRPVSSLNSTNWLFQNPPKSSARFLCVTSFALCNPVFHLGLWWHLWVTRPLCASVWTHVLMLHLSNPCTEPKGSQPN